MFDSTKRATSASVISLAVREAIEAYKESGKMVDAALAYAARGVPIFPLSQSKRPIPKRDKDPTGKYKKGIPGTGGVYKATCDPLIIRKWWREKSERAHRIADGRANRSVVHRRRYFGRSCRRCG